MPVFSGRKTDKLNEVQLLSCLADLMPLLMPENLGIYLVPGVLSPRLAALKLQLYHSHESNLPPIYHLLTTLSAANQNICLKNHQINRALSTYLYRCCRIRSLRYIGEPLSL
jgi:hypothetical protein